MHEYQHPARNLEKDPMAPHLDHSPLLDHLCFFISSLFALVCVSLLFFVYYFVYHVFKSLLKCNYLIILFKYYTTIFVYRYSYKFYVKKKPQCDIALGPLFYIVFRTRISAANSHCVHCNWFSSPNHS